MEATLRDQVRRAAARLRWQIVAPLQAAFYRRAVDAFAPRVERWAAAVPPRTAGPAGVLAYYLWGFPVLTETFIQREVAQLIAAGVQVEVFAHTASGDAYLSDAARALKRRTHYLPPRARRNVWPSARRFLARHPLRFVKLFLYVVLCRYDARKSFQRDCHLFKDAVYVAGILGAQGVTHVHAPWASINAFVAQVAAQLLRITYSVETRAYDLHRTGAADTLAAKLRGVQFVIANSQYNAATLGTLLNGRLDGRIKQIYEGVDLGQLQPRARQPRGNAIMRILCVARVIEAKGLEHLLRACRLMQERGCQVRCDIIGAREPLSVNYYIALQRLRRALHLDGAVTFHGSQSFEHVLDAYREADVFVLPSVIAADGTGDVTPNSLMEAMAMGLPVVSTRSRAIPEIVEDGVSGILVRPGDAAALADAVMRVMQDESLRAKLGINARRRIEERFDISKNIRAFVALFGSDG